MVMLPDLRRLTVSQSSRFPTRKALETFDALIVVTTAKPAASELRRVPQAAQLVKLLRRSGGKSVSTRLISARATALLLAPYSASSQFQSLSWAREVVATALRERPLKLGVVAVGLAEDARHAALTSLVAAAEAAAFELPSFKSDRKRKRRLAHLTLFDCSSRLDLGMLRAQALGNDIARWFTALPPNALTVSSYRAAVETLAKQFGISCRFLNETQLEKLGAGAFLAVSQGNKERDAGILHLRYRPRRQKAPDVAFVGKGILFDTGGTNLKPFKSMLDMHTDMQGSAVALGTLLAFASVEAPFAADAWLAVTPNRISAQSYTSQDIVTAANGTTIQVVHTDAEGRMVLADTLALASREEPALIIDYATLTGTCVMALTDRYSGTFSNRAAANALMRRAGAASGERVWPFPMDEDLEEPLKSEVADVKQCAIDGSGDHILAARFLSRFVPNRIPWVHIDLSSGQHKGGLAHVPSEITGFGVKLTLELLLANDPRALAAELGN